MPKSYLQLTYQDRKLISHWKARGCTVSEIALRVGVHKSTISRELRRNALITSREERLFWFKNSHLMSQEDLATYLKTLSPKEIQSRFGPSRYWGAEQGQSARQHRLSVAQKLRRGKSLETRKWVIAKIRASWSPEQIAGRSALEAPERVSYEFVYRLLHDDKKRGGRLYRRLKRFGKRKQRLGARNYPSGPIIPHRQGIEHRPKIVDERSRLGDLEGDLVLGHCSSGYVLSVIDRKSRYLVLRKLKTKRKTTVKIQLERAIRKMGKVHTLTVDNGTEFCDHRKLTEATGVPVYFTHPYTNLVPQPNSNET
jgi:IS30 family transposase